MLVFFPYVYVYILCSDGVEKGKELLFSIMFCCQAGEFSFSFHTLNIVIIPPQSFPIYVNQRK